MWSVLDFSEVVKNAYGFSRTSISIPFKAFSGINLYSFYGISYPKVPLNKGTKNLYLEIHYSATFVFPTKQTNS